MILLSASKVWLWVQRFGGFWSFLTWTGNHFLLLRHPDMSLEVVKVEPSKSLWPSPRIGWSRIKVDVLSSWPPPTNFIRPSATGKMNFPVCLRNIYYFLCNESFFLIDFRCVHRFQLLKVCNHYVTLPSLPRTESIQGTIQVILSFQIDGFLTGLSQK